MGAVSSIRHCIEETRHKVTRRVGPTPNTDKVKDRTDALSWKSKLCSLQCMGRNFRKERRRDSTNSGGISGDSEINMMETLSQYGYRLGCSLGSSRYGQVKQARRVGYQQLQLAVKIVDHNKAPDEFVKIFLPRELEALCWLRHRNITKVFQIICFSSYTCIVMERALGGNLCSFIFDWGPMESSAGRVVFQQVVSALQYCHAHKLAHRDIKCENVLLYGNDVVKLADFGFCRTCIEPDTKKRVMSDTFCGTLTYAAPEVISGVPYNPLASDMWSLGVVLFMMMYATIPFGGVTLSYSRNSEEHKATVWRQQMNQNWNTSDYLIKHISPDCQDLICSLLTPDVKMRATWRHVFNNRWLYPLGVGDVSNSILDRL